MTRFLDRAACAALLATAFVLAHDAAHAQTTEYTAEDRMIEVLVQRDDEIPGLGRVVSIGRVAVNDQGSWLVAVRTDHPDPDRDEAVLKDGAVVWTEGQALAGLAPGTSLRRIEAMGINARGDTCWNFALAGTPGGDGDNSAFYFNSRLVLQEGQPVLAQGIPPNTPYRRLQQVKLNGAGDALLLSSLRGPAQDSALGQGLFDLDLDLDGTLLLERPIAIVGYAFPALGGDLIVDVDPSAHTLAFNAAGDALYVTRATETAGGRYALLKNDALIAREGAPSTQAPGRAWQRLRGTPVALNDTGSVFFRGDLDGDETDDDVLVLDDRIVAREGQVLQTAIGPYPIRGFAYTTPLGLGNDGDTLYFAFLDKPQTKSVVAVLNGRVVLQEETTRVGDTWISALIEPPHLEHAALSPDASKLIVECRLFAGGEAAILVDLTRLPERFCNSSDVASCPCFNDGAQLAGCDNAAGTGGVRLRLVEQRQLPKNTATLIGTGFDLAARPAVLLRSDALETLPRVFGDGYRCLEQPLVRMSTEITAGGVSHHTVGHGSAAGAGTFHYQLWYGDSPARYCDPISGFNMSSGRSLSWR